MMSEIRKDKVLIEILNSEGKCTYRSLQEKLGLASTNTVSHYVNKLIKDGKVFKDINGKLFGVGTAKQQESIAFWKARCEGLEAKLYSIYRICDESHKPMFENNVND